MYGQNLMVSSWVALRTGCPIEFEVLGSGEAQVVCGTLPAYAFEFLIEADALRDFIQRGTDALHEMDDRYAQELAEHDDDQGTSGTLGG